MPMQDLRQTERRSVSNGYNRVGDVRVAPTIAGALLGVVSSPPVMGGYGQVRAISATVKQNRTRAYHRLGVTEAGEPSAMTRIEPSHGGRSRNALKATVTDRLLLRFDRLLEHQPAANVVVTAGGAGMAIALIAGWPLWAGFLGGFVPTLLILGLSHADRT